MAFSINHLYTLCSFQFQSEFNSFLLQNLRYPVNLPTSSITTKENKKKHNYLFRLGCTNKELMGKKILRTMAKSPLPTAETIDLLVKMLPLRHICMYRVDNIPPSDTFCSPLTVLCHGNFQAGNKSFF